MLRFFMMVLDKYGLDSLQLAVMCWAFWKLFTNHFKHFSNQLKVIQKKVESNETKLQEVSERVSHIEGKLE